MQITVHVKFRAKPISNVYALITKGGGNTPGYRVMVGSKGKAVCSFTGSLRTASVHGANALADRHWHTIVCIKRGRSISVSVDGATTSSSVRVGPSPTPDASSSEPEPAGGASTAASWTR
jgi:hypothetical protein